MQAGNESSTASNIRALITANTNYQMLYGVGYAASPVNLSMAYSGCPNTPAPLRLLAVRGEPHVFAVDYAGAIIDLKGDEVVHGKPVHQTPALRPSREAVTFAVDALWKKD
jgi:hypothetical protein